MIFEINKYLLNKMGWFTYSYSIGIGFKEGFNLFEDDDLVRFFIDIKDKKKCFVIKELNDYEKQKSKNTYKFIIADYNDGLPTMTIEELNSNEELFLMIIKYEACNEEYQRHFKINKLLNK